MIFSLLNDSFHDARLNLFSTWVKHLRLPFVGTLSRFRIRSWGDLDNSCFVSMRSLGDIQPGSGVLFVIFC